jgi:hypothetical protein
MYGEIFPNKLLILVSLFFFLFCRLTLSPPPPPPLQDKVCPSFRGIFPLFCTKMAIIEDFATIAWCTQLTEQDPRQVQTSKIQKYMEEPGEQCTVVFALIVKDQANEGVCVCGGGEGYRCYHPPPPPLKDTGTCLCLPLASSVKIHAMTTVHTSPDSSMQTYFSENKHKVALVGMTEIFNPPPPPSEPWLYESVFWYIFWKLLLKSLLATEKRIEIFIILWLANHRKTGQL